MSTSVAAIIWFFVPPASLIYAYLKLFELEKTDRPIVYVSMALSAVFVLLALLEVISGSRPFYRKVPDLDL